MKPLARWTIGKVKPDGFDCLVESVDSFLKFHDVDVIICHNCKKEDLPHTLLQYPLLDQENFSKSCNILPKGVAWKLYPPRLDENRHEIVIDNDIIFNDKIEQIDKFFENDCTLLLQGEGRTYGRFDKFVPKGFDINSGIYGMPPKFNIKSYIDLFAGVEWENNALGEHKESYTFDEQGLVAFSLLSYHSCIIIPNSIIVDCGNFLQSGKGYHFMTLNRREFHRPYRLYKSMSKKIYL